MVLAISIRMQQNAVKRSKTDGGWFSTRPQALNFDNSARPICYKMWYNNPHD
jgi:hypothetical protein